MQNVRPIPVWKRLNPCGTLDKEEILSLRLQLLLKKCIINTKINVGFLSQISVDLRMCFCGEGI